jgi:hypothetical protein
VDTAFNVRKNPSRFSGVNDFPLQLVLAKSIKFSCSSNKGINCWGLFEGALNGSDIGLEIV